MPTNFSGGAGTSVDPFLVSTAEQLDGMSDAWYVNDWSCAGTHFLQTEDTIDLGNAPFRPISGTGAAEFGGSYDGGGNRIINLLVTGNSANNDQLVGLFGITLGATIKNLTVEGTVSGDLVVGGLIGKMDGGLVRDVTVDVAVSGGYSVGGVVGSALKISTDSPVLEGVVSSGTVTGRNRGIVGGFPTPQSIGGIAGDLVGGEIREAVVNGNVIGPASDIGSGFGGAVGQMSPSSSTPAVLERSQVNGNVVAQAAVAVGGLAGKLIDNVRIDNSLSRGTVTGGEEVGGLVGRVQGVGVVIDDSLTTGTVGGSIDVGGSIGEADTGSGTGSGLVWNSTVNSTLNGVGLGTLTPSTATIAATTVQAKALSTYVAADWSITSDWTEDATWGICFGTSVNDGYPYLRWRYATDPCPPAPPTPAPSPTPPAPIERPVTPVIPVLPTTPLVADQPEPQAPTSSSMTISGQTVEVVREVAARDKGVALSAGPVSMRVRSEAPDGRSVPVAADGALLLARSGEVPIEASGLAPGSVVTQTLFSEPVDLGSTVVDASGELKATPKIPANTPLGSHTLSIQGTTKTGDPFTLNIGVTVATPAVALGSNPLLTATAIRHGNQTAVTATARGVQSRCQVTFTAGKQKARVQASSQGFARAALTLDSARSGSVKVTMRVTGKGCAPVTVVGASGRPRAH